GTGGAGKSSLVDELVRRYLDDLGKMTIAIISVDPSKRKTGGALLGDRIRMNSINDSRVYMRSLATRQSNLAMSKYVKDAVSIVKYAGFDFIILETSGIGQSDTEIIDHSDLSMYVMTPEYGAATQLEKIDMLDFADIIALNKFDKRGALDALKDVKKQYSRNHQLWDKNVDDMPVYGTVASQFNDPGVNSLYYALLEKIKDKTGFEFKGSLKFEDIPREKIYIIPPNRTRYLSEISETIRDYNQWIISQSDIADRLYSINYSMKLLKSAPVEEDKTYSAITRLNKLYRETQLELDPKNMKIIDGWEARKKKYHDKVYSFHVRNKEIKIETHTETLSHLQIPKITLPKYKNWGEILKWNLKENVPGEFPFAAGVFPFKREGEDPTR
ncbi:MAG: hypothetical protein KAR38_14175, partial [Calditrichia bacterium]|nr:hypothetical protein [Calditrichia bacterium]